MASRGPTIAARRCPRPGSLKKAEEGEIVGFGAAAGEDDAVGVAADGLCADQLADALTGFFEPVAGAAAIFVLAGGVQVRGGVALAHGLDDFRQNRGRGVVVEVNRFRAWG